MEEENKITLSYDKDKIELIINILNNMSFTGIQSAKSVTQIFSILDNPIVAKSEE